MGKCGKGKVWDQMKRMGSKRVCTPLCSLPSPSDTQCYFLLPDRPWPRLQSCSGGNKRCCHWDGEISLLWIHQNKILHLLHWWNPLWNQCYLEQREIWLYGHDMKCLFWKVLPIAQKLPVHCWFCDAEPVKEVKPTNSVIIRNIATPDLFISEHVFAFFWRDTISLAR